MITKYLIQGDNNKKLGCRCLNAFSEWGSGVLCPLSPQPQPTPLLTIFCCKNVYKYYFLPHSTFFMFDYASLYWFIYLGNILCKLKA